jgi:DNA-binding NarL/FixJ family response regulator
VVSNYQSLAQEQARREAGLTSEELEILAAMAEGASNEDMAIRFFCSEATVKRKVQEILEKLDASYRVQAVVKAVRRGWI